MKAFLMLSIVLLCGCGGGGVEGELMALRSEPVELCRGAQITVAGRDTTISDYFASDYKMVVYSDSLSCNSCALKQLYLWQDLIDYAKEFDGRLKYYFIFNPPANENIRIALRNSMLDYPMLLDATGEFARLNPHLPKSSGLHTFLLDERGEVVLVGSPLANPEIERMFKQIIEEKLNENEGKT